MSGMVLAYFLFIYQLCIASVFRDCEPQQEISGSKLHVPDIQRKNERTGFRTWSDGNSDLE